MSAEEQIAQIQKVIEENPAPRRGIPSDEHFPTPEPPPVRDTLIGHVATIHTYFVQALDEYETELRLLLLWQNWWRDRGYTTVVLNETHAERHPKYAEFRAKTDRFWSQNPRPYERACWLRWLALEVAIETTLIGAMCDYDVFPRALTPIPVDGEQFTIFEPGVPCLASGTHRTIREMIDYILGLPDDIAPEGKHYSDMLAIRNFPNLKTVPLARQFTDTDWLNAPFVHCSHGSMHPNKKIPRHQHVAEVMALK